MYWWKMNKYKLNIFLFAFFLVSCNFPENISYIGNVPYLLSLKEGYFSVEGGKNNFGINSEKDINLIKITEKQYEDENSTKSEVQWTQKDFDLIVQKVHLHVWDESVSNFKLESMLFSSKCAEVEKGIQKGYYTYYSTRNHERIEHRIWILPRNSLIKWSEKVYSINSYYDGDFDLSNINISADQALIMAEKEGGEKIRLDNENNCIVQITISDYQNNLDWQVTYSSLDINKIEPLFLFKAN